MYSTHSSTHCSQCAAKDTLITMLSRDPGFEAYTPAYTLHYIDQRALETPDERVSVYVGDLDDLKQVNSATGSQARADELYNPALRVRASDGFIGKIDGGDGFMFIFPVADGPGAIARIRAELALAPLMPAERRRLIAERRKKYGMVAVSGHLTITIAAHEDIAWKDVPQLFACASGGLLAAKAAGLRGQVVP